MSSADPTSDEPPERSGSDGALRDAALGGVLWLLNLGALIESVRLTFGVSFPGSDDQGVLIAPGFMPLALTLALFVMLSAVVVSALRRGALTEAKALSQSPLADTFRPLIRPLGQAILLCIFVFGLVGLVPFWAAAALYLFAALLLARALKWYWAGLLALSFAVVIHLLMGPVLGIPLP